jgi:hypothetical protein
MDSKYAGLFYYDVDQQNWNWGGVQKLGISTTIYIPHTPDLEPLDEQFEAALAYCI